MVIPQDILQTELHCEAVLRGSLIQLMLFEYAVRCLEHSTKQEVL